MGVPNRQSVLSYACSALLHAGLIAVVIWRAASIPTPASPPGVHTAVSDRSVDDRSDDAHWNSAHAGDSAAIDSARSVDVDTVPSAESPGLAEFARERLARERAAAVNKSAKEQVAELESLARQLERVASENSVRDLSGTLSEWLGANKRVADPAARSSGAPFDIGSAQIADVRKIEAAAGIQYVARLVDAQGNSRDVPLDQTDGHQLYEVFQLMKTFPLLETVYRGTVMGLLDNLAASPASTEPTQTPPVQAESPSQ